MPRSAQAEEPDALLARLAGGGDERAWSAFVTRCYGTIYRTAHQIIGDHHVAEDAAQDTLIRIAGAVRGYRQHADGGAAAAQAWILRIAHNTAVDHARRLAVQRRRQAGTKAAVDTSIEDPAIHDGLPALRQALAALPERHRHPLVLRFLEGMSYDDIARGLGCAEELARKRVQRALVMLRHRVGGALVGSSVVLLPAGVAPATPALTWTAAQQAASALPAASAPAGAAVATKPMLPVIASIAMLGCIGIAVVALLPVASTPVPATPTTVPPPAMRSLLIDDHEQKLRWHRGRHLRSQVLEEADGHVLRCETSANAASDHPRLIAHPLTLTAPVTMVRFRLLVERAAPGARLSLNLGERDGEYWGLVGMRLTAAAPWRDVVLPARPMTTRMVSGGTADNRFDHHAVTHLHLVLHGDCAVRIDDLTVDLSP